LNETVKRSLTQAILHTARLQVLEDGHRLKLEQTQTRETEKEIFQVKHNRYWSHNPGTKYYAYCLVVKLFHISI
jgi:hypothetical protein